MRPSVKRRLCYTLMWVERIRPSTTRNGFKGAVMNCFFLYFLISPQGISRLPFACDVFGINCPSNQVEELHEPHARQWHELLVMPGRGKGSHVCECHTDIKSVGQSVRHVGVYQVSCDSDIPSDFINKWSSLTCLGSDGYGGDCWHFVINGKEIRNVDSWRWHCTSNPNYAEEND